MFSFIGHRSLLVNLNIGFHVVAVSESWDSFATPLSINVNILGILYFLLSLKVKMVVLVSTSKLLWILFQDLTRLVTVMSIRQFGLKLRIQKMKAF